MILYGKKEAVGRLSKFRRSGRFPHGILFCGDEGCGKGVLADYTAMLYLCKEGKEAPCFSCNECKRIAERAHPDVIYADGKEWAFIHKRIIIKLYFALASLKERNNALIQAKYHAIRHIACRKENIANGVLLFLALYFISCSKFLNSSVSKNSVSEIPKPSQSIFIVTIPGLVLLPYKIFFILDGGTADSIASL